MKAVKKVVKKEEYGVYKERCGLCGLYDPKEKVVHVKLIKKGELVPFHLSCFNTLIVK